MDAILLDNPTAHTITRLIALVKRQDRAIMSESFRKEQSDLLRHIETHQQANQTYLDEGVHLLELAQKAVVLYDKQDMREKRRLLDFVCSNSQWRDGNRSRTTVTPLIYLLRKHGVYKNRSRFPYGKRLSPSMASPFCGRTSQRIGRAITGNHRHPGGHVACE